MDANKWGDLLNKWLTGPNLHDIQMCKLCKFYCKSCKFLLFFTICQSLCCCHFNYSVAYLIYKGDFFALETRRE